MDDEPKNEFEKAAREEREPSFAGELWLFLKNEKKWWLLPIVLVLLALGILLFLSGTVAAPFIYTLF